MEDYGTLSVYFRAANGEIGGFDAPYELPLDKDKVNACLNMVKEEMRSAYIQTGHQRAVLAVIPGGKA